MKTLKLFAIAFLALGLTACDDDELGPLGGEQSPMGEVGNTFSVSGMPAGVENVNATVTELENGVSTIRVNAKITNSTLLTLAKALGYDDGEIEREAKFKATSKGIERVYDDGVFTLVRYDAKVGDTYTYQKGTESLKRKVVQKSTEDEYYWNGWLLKTITVRETGRNIPGLMNTEYIFNHRFGIVGFNVNLADGSSYNCNVVSANY